MSSLNLALRRPAFLEYLLPVMFRINVIDRLLLLLEVDAWLPLIASVIWVSKDFIKACILIGRFKIRNLPIISSQ